MIEYSVIIPIYNAAATLERCLLALEKALPPQSEVILVDDCSTDNSLDIAKRFSHQIIEKEKNTGPSSSRNIGAKVAKGEYLIFIDSDVFVKPDAIHKIVYQIQTSSEILGGNGLPTRELPFSDWASQYVNLSLLFQLQQHGKMVSTCFTSLCVLRKEAWRKMDGWDEGQHSRYSDDVQSRWFLPEHSIVQVFDANFIHHKKVSWKGLFRHRFNLGYHFLRGLSKPRKKGGFSWKKTIIHVRYPLNTVLALCCFFALLFPPLLFLILFLLIVNNWFCFRFVKQSQSWERAISVFGLSLLEGMCFLFGIGWGVIHER